MGTINLLIFPNNNSGRNGLKIRALTLRISTGPQLGCYATGHRWEYGREVNKKTARTDGFGLVPGFRTQLQIPKIFWQHLITLKIT